MTEWLFDKGHRACAGCGCALCMKLILKALGRDVIVVNATGCMEIVSTLYPESAWNVPYIHSLFENAPAVASGVSRALKAKGNDHTKVVAIGGDGATSDIGFGALSGMLERNEDVLYIEYDNEAYENTGMQRSSATPKYAFTTTSQVGSVRHGKTEWKKPLVDIVAAHGVPYAASASIAFPFDLERKLKKAAAMEGARFIAIHASCNLGWGHDPKLTIEKCRQAVDCGLWALKEHEGGEVKINYKPKMIPVKEYFDGQKRFKHVTDVEAAEVQEKINGYWKELREENGS